MYKITRIITGVPTDIVLTSEEVQKIYEKRDMEMYAADLEVHFGDEFTWEEYLAAALEVPMYLFDELCNFYEALDRTREWMLKRREPNQCVLDVMGG